MIFATPPNPPPEPVQYAETARELPETMIQVPPDATLGEFICTYPNRLIALDGGKVLLRLRDDPVVEFNPSSSRWTIVGWGLAIPHEQLHDISRLMGRRFLQLFRRAKEDQLTNEERSDWITLLDHIDYTSFCIEREPPLYMEGTLLRKNSKVRVEWHDGQTEYIPPTAAISLEILEEGERFGAFVKWGRWGIQSIERVDLLPDMATNERA
jgi:hypothetical protein